MNRCIVEEGEKWATCSDHKNTQGGHGEYICVYLYKESIAYNAPQYCRLRDCKLPDDLFYLEK